jgi:hypothetical protein
MTHNRPFLAMLLSLAVIVFSGCSGSTLDSDTNTPNSSVLVNAGSDLTVNEQTTVTLSAQASGQTPELTYVWQVSPILTITQEDNTTGIASFVAPTTTETLTYTFTLNVTDGNGNLGSDSVVYQVNPINVAPTAVIQVSQADGLSADQFPAGFEVILDGSQSFDLDSASLDAPISTYMWQQTAGESVLSGISQQGDSLSFFTPVLDQANSLTISLTVTDEEGAEDTQEVTLSIQSSSDTLPVVDAGKSHEVFSGESINLNGQAYTTVAASIPLTTIWLNDSEKDPLIENLNALQTVAVAPQVSSTETLTFTLRVMDNQGNSVDDSLTVTVRPPRIQPINDSGVVQQATAIQILTTYQADYPGQDGQRGQDILHANGVSAKAGRGQQGFDFTRLDDVGDEVDEDTSSWNCVRDNITGLIWESKTAPLSTDLHSINHNYSWFQTEDNGGFEGEQNNLTSSCSLTNCNTETYIAQVNSQGLCNFRDWRLPTHNELLSLVHFGQTATPMIDADYFPNTTNSLSTPAWYWTQNSSADGFSNEQAQNAWAIDFATGNDNFLHKSTAARVRLVRAGR